MRLQQFSKWPWCCGRREQERDEIELLSSPAPEGIANYDALYHTIPKFVVEQSVLKNRELSSVNLRALFQEFGVTFSINKIKCIKDILKLAKPEDVSKIIDISTLNKNPCQFKITLPMLRIFYESFHDNLVAANGNTILKEIEEFKQYSIVFIQKLLQRAKARLKYQASATQAGPSLQPAQNRLLLGELHADSKTRAFVSGLVTMKKIRCC